MDGSILAIQDTTFRSASVLFMSILLQFTIIGDVRIPKGQIGSYELYTSGVCNEVPGPAEVRHSLQYFATPAENGPIFAVADVRNSVP